MHSGYPASHLLETALYSQPLLGLLWPLDALQPLPSPKLLCPVSRVPGHPAVAPRYRGSPMPPAPFCPGLFLAHGGRRPLSQDTEYLPESSTWLLEVNLLLDWPNSLRRGRDGGEFVEPAAPREAWFGEMVRTETCSTAGPGRSARLVGPAGSSHAFCSHSGPSRACCPGPRLASSCGVGPAVASFLFSLPCQGVSNPWL